MWQNLHGQILYLDIEVRTLYDVLLMAKIFNFAEEANYGRFYFLC